MQVIITAAGKGTRFSEQGYAEPKPAIEIARRPAIAYLIESFALETEFIFVLGEHFKNSRLEKIILNLRPESQIIYTAFSERGPVDTVLAAARYLKKNEPVMTAYCDMGFICDWSRFIKHVKEFDFAFLNYQGFHPTYFGANSYCHVQVDINKNEVIAIQEKKLFTTEIEKEITSLGVYYFQSAELLLESLNEQLLQNLNYRNEFYISLAIQAMKNKNQQLKILDFRVENVLQLGTPSDLERFEFWYDYLVNGIERIQFKYIEKANKPQSAIEEKFKLEQQYWLKLFAYFKSMPDFEKSLKN